MTAVELVVRFGSVLRKKRNKIKIYENILHRTTGMACILGFDVMKGDLDSNC